MDFVADPAELTPAERFLDLAAILARGYLRLRKRHVPAFPAPVVPESADSRLDFPAEPRPPLGSGLTPGREVAG